MPAYCHEEWSQLVGAFVEIRNDKRCLRSGFVDDAMADSSVLWLAADGFDGRALIAKAEGYQVWVEPRQLEGPWAYRITFSALNGPTTEHEEGE